MRCALGLLALTLGLAACPTSAAQVGSECLPGELPDLCFSVGLACTVDYTLSSTTGGLCELPGELFPCLATPGCASGFSCIGGDGGLCLMGCQSTADCWDPLTTCQDAGGTQLCEPAVCTDFWEPCAAADPDGGDGTCIVVSESPTGLVGACLQGGDVPSGGTCNYFREPDAGLCVPGQVCMTSLSGANTGVCLAACDATIAEDGGPACNGGCTFAAPPAPPPGLSSLDIFNRLGGCASLCPASDVGTDAGCASPTTCVDTGEGAPVEFQCLPTL